MAIINTALGGTDASDGDVLYAAGLNDTYNEVANRDANYAICYQEIRQGLTTLNTSYRCCITSCANNYVLCCCLNTDNYAITHCTAQTLTHTSQNCLNNYFRNLANDGWFHQVILSTNQAGGGTECATFTSDINIVPCQWGCSPMAFSFSGSGVGSSNTPCMLCICTTIYIKNAGCTLCTTYTHTTSNCPTINLTDVRIYADRVELVRSHMCAEAGNLNRNNLAVMDFCLANPCIQICNCVIICLNTSDNTSFTYNEVARKESSCEDYLRLNESCIQYICCA